MLQYTQVSKMNAPCKGCDKRYPACHDHCEDYKAYKEQLATVKESFREYTEGERAAIESAGRHMRPKGKRR